MNERHGDEKGRKMDSEKKPDGKMMQVDPCSTMGVALIGIIVQNESSAPRLNDILHEYRNYVIGRMGVPYKQKSLSIISLAVDAPADVISSLAGKIGMLDGVSSKTLMPKIDNADGDY